MATALMQDDDLSINRFNPYTWTGTYGVSSDGSHNWQPDGTFTRPYDDAPSDRLDTNRDLKDFNVMALNDASNMWFNTMPGKPTAPFPAFPARKYERNDGALSWVRPDYVMGPRGQASPIFFVAILAAAAFMLTRMKR